MSKLTFNDFISAVDVTHLDFVNSLHEYLMENGCKVEVKEAANGYVTSYSCGKPKRTIFNYVFRKDGLMMRLYADNAAKYEDVITNLPAAMKEAIKKAGVCKRMVDPTKCNSRCKLGFEFLLDGEKQQICRYALMFFVNDETKPFLREIVENEL